MAGVRDPQFWKRFSMAVHLDEEKASYPDNVSTATSTSNGRYQLKPTETWLERNKKKRRRTRLIGWLIALAFAVVIAAVVIILLWYVKVGPFKSTT